MEIKASIVVNSFEVNTQSRHPIRVKAAFKIGNIPTAMNQFDCTIPMTDKAIELIEQLKNELAKGVGEKITEELTNE